MIEREKVNHIANLAKLEIKEEEMEHFQKQLTDIMTEIDKILDVDVDGDIMISPTFNEDRYSEDVIETHVNKVSAFKNAKRVKQDYISVPKVIEGEH